MYNKISRFIVLATVLSVVASSITINLSAAEKKEDKKARGVPYAGTVATVDKAAKTITIKKKEASRVFEITAETRISKSGKPATLDDAIIGEEAAAYGHEQNGKHIAQSLRLGTKPEDPSSDKKKKKTADKK